ncbi:hypothetical protein HIT06_004250 [Escherichia coli]|nr:hypothetical protein [Escherichia coli]EFI9529078.1 hypothetical protein [Escherichia coli]EFK7925341.1 hypothetical protein [Escherichia coli]EFK7980171.1 hypothetical protein [Escherichia coli]EJF9110439.1 hypothetical protein [Escherichia coli]
MKKENVSEYAELIFGAVSDKIQIKSRRLKRRCNDLIEKEIPSRIFKFTNFLNCGVQHLFVLHRIKINIPYKTNDDIKKFTGGIVAGSKFIGLIVVDLEEERLFVYQYSLNNRIKRKFRIYMKIKNDSPVKGITQFTKVNLWYWDEVLKMLMNKL